MCTDLGVESLSHLHATMGDGHRSVFVVDGDQGDHLGKQIHVVPYRQQGEGSLAPAVVLEQ